MDNNYTCNCKHNSNSRDNEPCCRCDRKQTNADRIRNMSDEELAEYIMCPAEYDLGFNKECECNGEMNINCCKCTLEWLHSEAE